MNSFQIHVLLTCPTGAAQCLTRLREVLEPFENIGETWPTVQNWERVLPTWFTSACAIPMSSDEAQASNERWRRMSQEERAALAAKERWSLPDWLYWMEPEQSVWRWVDATIKTPNELVVTLAVDGWPVALGAFEWLARAAGADVVTVP